MASTSFATRKMTPDRQYPLVAVVRFDFEKLAAAEDGIANMLQLPGNAIVTGGALHVLTAWDSAGTATLSLGDDDSATRYLSTANLKAAARTAITLPNFQHQVPTILFGTFAEGAGDSAEQGEALLIVEYIIEGRGGEIQ